MRHPSEIRALNESAELDELRARSHALRELLAAVKTFYTQAGGPARSLPTWDALRDAIERAEGVL